MGNGRNLFVNMKLADRLENILMLKYLRDSRVLTPLRLKKLISLPCLFIYETGVSDKAYIGKIKRILPRPGIVRIEYEINKKISISHKRIEQLSLELDIHKWELNRTHWAVKDINLFRELEKEESI